MADWTELDTNGLLPGEPLTSAKALAFFENPVAMAEGKVNAPKVVSEALNMLVGAGASTTSFTNLERIDKVLINTLMTHTAGAGNRQMRYRTSTNNGSSWGGYSTFGLTALTSAPTGGGAVVVSLGSSINAIEISVFINGSSSGEFNFSVLGVSGISP